MDKDLLLKQITVYAQLASVLKEINNGKYDEFVYYQKETPVGSPRDFILEIIEIDKGQSSLTCKIKQIQEFYHCDENIAILLLRFTDAQLLMRK